MKAQMERRGVAVLFN